MIYSIGTPGQPARLYITTDIPANAQLQCQDGEVCVEVDAVPMAEILVDPRNERDELLAASDKTQLPDAPLTPEKVAEWAAYRQALREMTFDDPIQWPTPPASAE